MTQSIKKFVFRDNIPIIHHYLILLFAFSLPFGPAINSILSVLIILLWLIEGNFKEKYEQTLQNPIAVWAILFLLAHVVGLIWTQDMDWGLHIVRKEMKFLLLPILLTIIRKEHIKSYIIAFLLAMTISEIISYLIWFELIPPTSTALKGGFPTPFVEHHSYTPFLAFAIYILLHGVLFDKSLNRKEMLLALFFIITMSFNLFIAGGRAGQVGFFVIYGLIVLQYFHKNLLKGILVAAVTIPLVFTLLYMTAPAFQKRVDHAVSDIKVYDQNPNTSVGLRIHFMLNSLRIIEAHPLLGVGTGDYPSVYKKVNEEFSPKAIPTVQPHNMYLLILSELGVFGFIPFMMLFYTQIKASFSKRSPYFRIQLALPALFMIIMLSDSYLLGHFTTMLFIFFSAILFKDVDVTS